MIQKHLYHLTQFIHKVIKANQKTKYTILYIYIIIEILINIEIDENILICITRIAHTPKNNQRILYYRILFVRSLK